MFIAEVKIHSPAEFDSDYSFEELFEIAAEYGDMVSVHTEERWLGSLKNVTYARTHTSKPIVAKGMHSWSEDEIDRCLEAGADYVWVVGYCPRSYYAHTTIIEPYDLDQLKMISHGWTGLVAWNQRDIRSFGKRVGEDWEEARQIRPHLRLGCASLIKHPYEVPKDADFYVVGEHLPEYTKRLDARGI
jgi:indole-3-glycerol phosphate synthase